jgi:hypothetical protein
MHRKGEISMKTVKQLAEERPFFTESSLRWMLFNRSQNGLNAAVIKIGKKILIDETKFDKWVDKHREVD